MTPPSAHPAAGSSGDSPRDVRILSVDDVRKVAKLARLAITDERVQQYRGQLAAVLGYMGRLREVNLQGVEPMTHPPTPGGHANRLDEDAPAGATGITTEAFMAMAPEKMEPFVKVPKVLGEGGGA